MASATIKSTYSLDVETVRTLETLARGWKVSKSEALRRAIRIASEQGPHDGSEALRALDELQASLGLGRGAARRWARAARADRRESSSRRERRPG